MKGRKTLRVNVSDLLRLIDHAKYHDHDSTYFYNGMAKLLSFKLSDDEIENYCVWYLSEDGEDAGYSKADYEDAKDRLAEFRESFCKKK